jgi:signal transduction histidine kinase
VAAAAVAGFGVPAVSRGLLDAPFPLSMSITATPGHLLDASLGSILGVGGATLIGAYVRTRRAYVSELADRARRLEREREERAERAVEQERARIARELHDVAAHHLSGIALQATALDRVVDRDPGQARGLAAEIRSESSTALAAMRRLVTVLRADDTDGRAPQPGLDDLHHLIARRRDDGASIGFELEERDGLEPPEVELAAYRIVQEALTNARRHAPEAHVAVHVRRLRDGLELEIVDEGLAAGPAEPGHGMLGMHERVGLLGGTFTAGPRSDAPGWRVHAYLPSPAGDG